jgi:hypothetical protein
MCLRFLDMDEFLHHAEKVVALSSASEGIVQLAVKRLELVANGLVFWLRVVANRLEQVITCCAEWKSP